MAETQYQGVGRRKTSVARVYLRPGNGAWKVNDRELGDYFPRPSDQTAIRLPLVVTETEGRFDVHVVVDGGGLSGQAGAIRLGLSRALVSFDEDLRKTLREHNMLTRDPREVERKKPGRPGARKRFQFSKR